MYLSAIYNYKDPKFKKKRERENKIFLPKSLHHTNLGGRRGSLPILPLLTPPSRPLPPPLKAMNFEFEREIAYKQPAIARRVSDFLPLAVLETFQTSSIKESTLIPPPPPFEQTFPSLQPGASTLQRPGSQKEPKMGPASPPLPPPSPPLASSSLMKEKKSAKKPSQSAASPPAARPGLRVGSPAGR